MTPYSPPMLHDVSIEYRLVNRDGYTPTTQQKRWFFETPPTIHGSGPWLELVQRIFYDANVAMQRREPNDVAWFYVDQVRVRPLDVKAMLAWDGQTNLESGLAHLPWMVSEARIVWEPGACFMVAEDRRYVALGANAFTQLVAYRERHLRGLDDAALGAFLEKVFPGEGLTRAGPWQERLDAIRRVPAPPVGVFRRPPGENSVSGPPSAADLRR